MATSSLAAARTLLYNALNVTGVNGVVTRVFDYEPAAGEMAKPASVTIFATGVTPDFWQFAARIYHTTDTSAEAAQKNIDIIILAVEAAMHTAGIVNIGPSQWTIGFTDGIDALVAQSDITIVREDF
jgi:hypothetical protein